jgi:hypothetical protein
LVAIPTAIPVAPFINNVGTRVGITFGHTSIIKIQLKINSFFSISANISSEILRISNNALLGLSPSTDPKLP